MRLNCRSGPGGVWRRASPVSSEGASLWGVNATADATTRLAVSAAASLFNHAGAGHQLKLNKAGPADTASLLLQTGWSGRAEIGLAGDDDLHVKVSGDGSALARGAGDRPRHRPGQPAGNALGAGAAATKPAGEWRFAAQPARLRRRGAWRRSLWPRPLEGRGCGREPEPERDSTIALASGAIVQIVEPALWGLSSPLPG